MLCLNLVHNRNTHCQYEEGTRCKDKILAGVYTLSGIVTSAELPVLKMVPAPISSLTAPRIVIAQVKPSPMPSPSNADGRTGF